MLGTVELNGVSPPDDVTVVVAVEFGLLMVGVDGVPGIIPPAVLTDDGYTQDP